MKLIRPLLLVAVLAAIGVAGFFAFDPFEKHMRISHVNAAPLEDGAPDSLVVFLKIENGGGPDTLLSAKAHNATETILYNPESEQGLPVPGNTTPSLAADGAHLVLRGVEGPIEDGRLFPVELTFEQAGTVTAKARLVAPVNQGDAGNYGIFGLGDICRVEEGEPAPEVSLRTEPKADGTGWRVLVDAKDFTFAEHLTGTDHIPGVGHGHLYVNGLKIGRLYENVMEFGALPKGTHTVRVSLNTNDHRAYVIGDTPVMAEATIIVN